MESFAKNVTTTLKTNPTIKKLRALEQSRMAKQTAKQTVRKDQLKQSIQRVKTQVIENIKSQADDLLELAKILEEDPEDD